MNLYEEYLSYLKEKLPLPMSKEIAFSLLTDILQRDGFAEENADAESRNKILEDWVALIESILTGEKGVAFYLPLSESVTTIEDVGKEISKKSKKEFSIFSWKRKRK